MPDVARMTLAEARDLLKWTQAKLAAESGLERSAVYDIEAGRSQNPSYITVSKIIAALRSGGLVGLTPEDIFGPPENESRAS